MTNAIFSFDVFDTCLCRLCGEPRLMFDVLSLKVQKAMGELCNEHVRQRFVAARVDAGGNNLIEIYRQVAQVFPIPYSIEQMTELEMETEREMLVPILATREMVNQLRTKGEILFISDMYLPSEFIKERLVDFGFFQEGDQLFVSDELQAWKSDGSLYRLVHERKGMRYRYWHHYGDNRHSDYKVPKKLGIHAHHLHYDYLPYEEQWRQMPVLQYQYSSILAGVARAVRLSTEASGNQKAFVCDISALLMVSWIFHVMEDAWSHGIKRLYFCARDVHTEYLIARWLKRFCADLEVKYLFISMKAMEEEEDRLYGYLVQEGVLSKESVALVDSISSGNTLVRINAIANRKQWHPVQGYYLSEWNPNKILDPTVDDLKRLHYLNNSLYSNRVASSQIRKLLGMRILYELVFSINFHKRTIGYEYHDSIMRPVFETDSEDKWFIEGADVRQTKRDNDRMALVFVNYFYAVGLNFFSKDILYRITVPTLAEFVDRPNRTYLQFLHYFVWQGSPFVGRIFGRKKGVWSRGNLFYSLPSVIIVPLRTILSDTGRRSKYNRLLAWIKRK